MNTVLSIGRLLSNNNESNVYRAFSQMSAIRTGKLTSYKSQKGENPMKGGKFSRASSRK